MRARRRKELLILTFSPVEARILQRVFHSLTENYRISPAKMHPKCAAAWYSTRGCESACLSSVETREWLNDLHAQKAANLPRIENWSGQIALPPAEQYRIRLKAAEGVHLMTALNDHRLMTAARNDIGQEEMEMSLFLAFQRLTPAQHHARCEIDFLAWVIEELLRLEPDDCTDWQKHKPEH